MINNGLPFPQIVLSLDELLQQPNHGEILHQDGWLRVDTSQKNHFPQMIEQGDFYRDGLQETAKLIADKYGEALGKNYSESNNIKQLVGSPETVIEVKNFLKKHLTMEQLNEIADVFPKENQGTPKEALLPSLQQNYGTFSSKTQPHRCDKCNSNLIDFPNDSDY